jgi:hypothetical protein
MKEGRMQRSGLAIAVVLSTLGGCLDLGDEDVVDEPVGTTAQEIIGGTVVSPEGSGWVLVLAGGLCSGTLLHNDWVITAKHCGVAIGSTFTMGSQTRTATRVVDHPTTDVSLARLSAPMAMGGSTNRWRRPLRRTVLPVGTTVQCYGYGRDTFGGGSGTLRTAALAISSTADPNYAFDANASGQIQWLGDSGGGCIDGAGNALFVQSGCSYFEGGPVVSCWGTRADVIAEWADRIIYGYFGSLQLAHNDECFDGEDCYFGDVDGDGADDLVTFSQGASGNVWVGRSNGNTQFLPVSHWRGGFCTTGQICRLGDVNADGRADAIAFDPPSGDVFVATSNGTAFVGATTAWHGSACFAGEHCEVGDVTGDGRADVAAFSSGAVWVLASTGTAFAVSGSWQWHTSFCAGATAVGKLADVDADGDADAVEFVRGGVGDVFVARSSTAGFGARTFWHDWFCVGGEVCDTGDVDGDGKADVVAFTRSPAGDVYAAVSTGNSFLGTGWKWNDWFCLNDWLCRLGDINGDGRTDAVSASNDVDAQIWLSRSTAD